MPTKSPLAPEATAAAVLRPGGGPVDAQDFADLLATPDGFLALAPWDEGVLVRGSADGTAWERLDAAAAFGPQLEDVVAGPVGWVASQRIESATSIGVGTALWFSADGHEWERLPDHAALGASFPGPLSAGPWGFGMAGQVIDGSGTSVAAVWVSRDGRHWQLDQLEADSSDLRLIVTSAGVLAIDRALGRLAFTTDGFTWSEPVEDLALVDSLVGHGPSADTLVAARVAAGRLTVRTANIRLSSTPTLVWQDIDQAPFAGAGATGFAAGERGALLIGYDLKTLAPRTWQSVDGRAWQRTDLGPATFGGGVPALAAVGQGAFVALGWEVSASGAIRPQPWVSHDGRSWSPGNADGLGLLPSPMPSICPSTTPTDVAGLVAMTDEENQVRSAAWPACFGDMSLQIRGYIQGCGGCGGVPAYTGTPEWLLDPEGYSAFWLSSIVDPELGRGIGIQIDPGRPVSVPAVGSYVRVTGHFDDPAAVDCRLIPIPGMLVAVPPAAETTARCRAHFVAEDIELVRP